MQTPLGVDGGVGAGVRLGPTLTFGQLALIAEASFGGGTVSASGAHFGFRLYAADTPASLYAGAGFGWQRIEVGAPNRADFQGDGSGASSYGELGVAVLRESPVGVFAGLRLDVPLFSLEGAGSIDPATGFKVSVDRFTQLLSINIGVTF